jgi:hypothetical protein
MSQPTEQFVTAADYLALEHVGPKPSASALTATSTR